MRSWLVETIDLRTARRLALARAGLLKPQWTGFPTRAAGRGKRARRAAQRIIERFGYLQIDTVSIAGARSHALVLLSRLDAFDPELAEELLQPGEPLFEYWGHEASWMPIELYPLFDFRRRALSAHPWWGDVVGEHPEVASDLLRRIRDEGPLRSIDMEGRASSGWWDLGIVKRVASALWSSGELAIRERRSFQRTYDLAERVIPGSVRACSVPESEAFDILLMLALRGHGWATTGTLTQTWRLAGMKEAVEAGLARLVEQGRVVRCVLATDGGAKSRGWIRRQDLELAARLKTIRPRRDRGVLLSPFDPLLWDRPRVQRLFGFHQILEIFKPAAQRRYGYYCLPVLAGEHLVARLDLKADRKNAKLDVLSTHFEEGHGGKASPAREAVRAALARYADSVKLATA